MYISLVQVIQEMNTKSENKIHTTLVTISGNILIHVVDNRLHSICFGQGVHIGP